MNTQIIELLRKFGIPASVKGYGYLKTALDLCWEDKSYLESITKRLYPAIAKRHNTTASRVERAIRHAIETAWSRVDLDTLNSVFGCTVSRITGKPTNSEFIATLTEQLNLEYGEIKTADGR